MYEVLTGSVAYGVSNDMSDQDIYGWTIPPKEVVFPWTAGVIPGFGSQGEVFEQFQNHHIKDASTGRVYDLTIYNIVRYFQLCMENNPNMVDTLFVPQRCILHMTPVGQMVRDRRRDFLHKGAFHKLKGYAYSQLSKMDVKKQDVPEVHMVWDIEKELEIPHNTTLETLEHACDLREKGLECDPLFDHIQTVDLLRYRLAYQTMYAKNKRLDGIKKFGFDVKFGYHVVRLASEAEQILLEGDLDLEEPGRREHMKAIRRGEVSEDDIREWFAHKEKVLEQVYVTSTLRHKPDEESIKQLLMDCLEHHYGSLSAVITIPGQEKRFMDQIGQIIDQYRARDTSRIESE